MESMSGLTSTFIVNFLNIKIMNNIKNTIMLIGHLGKDAEMKQLEGGKSLARVTLATNDTYKKENGEKVTDTQ